jgi:epoxyqueuosine reductase
MSQVMKTTLEQEPAEFIREKIKDFVVNSQESKLAFLDDYPMYDEPLVKFADGDDSIFSLYKEIIGTVHLTPREAMSASFNKAKDELPSRLSVISWVLPIAEGTRKANRAETNGPSRLWSHTRWYGEKLNEKLGEYMVKLLSNERYMAVTPQWQPYFKMFSNEKGPFSNWSERHIAYAAGQGTFSLSDGFITERGIAHRCASLVTNLELPVSPRTATGPYSNCLAYVGVECKACINRCPAGAISKEGHNKPVCQQFMRTLGYNSSDLAKNGYKNDSSVAGCGLCQTKVPCEFENPTRKLKK